jgi:hypothetical protein
MTGTLEDQLQSLSIEDVELISLNNTGHHEWMNKSVEECHRVLSGLSQKKTFTKDELHEIHSICIACRKMTSTGTDQYIVLIHISQ